MRRLRVAITAARSVAQGRGVRARTAVAAAAGDSGPGGAGEAVGITHTGRPVKPARVTAAIASAWRAGQSAAAAQPLSTTKSNGPCPGRSRPLSKRGPAKATISRPAISNRNRINHQGVRWARARSGTKPAKSAMGGKAMTRGAGGCTRRKINNSGNTANPANNQGTAKVSVLSAAIAAYLTVSVKWV